MTRHNVTDDAGDWLAGQFEGQRPRLRAIAQRMLGSAEEAEDAVQDAWLRVSRAGVADVTDLRAWLTTVVSRICLDVLRARRARREELAGEWLPEPVLAAPAGSDPAQEAELADAIGLALLVVLESLSPPERLAFVLHDLFGVPFAEVGPMIGRDTGAARQLASRARRRLHAEQPRATAVRLSAQRTVADAFLAASRTGDFEALVALLAPEAELRVARRSAPSQPPMLIRGSAEIAAAVMARGRPLAHLARAAVIGGRPGFVVGPPGEVVARVAFTVTGGGITAIDVIADPPVAPRPPPPPPPPGYRTA